MAAVITRMTKLTSGKSIKREKERKRRKERERERERVCVCVSEEMRGGSKERPREGQGDQPRAEGSSG